MWIVTALQETATILIALAIFGYAAVALACMAFTFAEGKAEAHSPAVWRMAGLSLCLVWPFMIVVFAILQRAGRRLTPA